MGTKRYGCVSNYVYFTKGHIEYVCLKACTATELNKTCRSDGRIRWVRSPDVSETGSVMSSETSVYLKQLTRLPAREYFISRSA